MRSCCLLLCLLVSRSFGAEMLAPEGFEVRDFGPIGGQIIIPRGWFVSQGTRGTQYLFTVSKEDLAVTGHYETGWRIQWIAEVSKTAKITATQAVQYNIDRKKASEEVVRECDLEKSGEFNRRCLETLSPVPSKPGMKYHIIYSFFWSDEKDMMVAGTFGAPMEEWDSAAKIYRVIKDFKLLDWDRVEAKKKAAGVGSVP
jgi:hypothetical protein